MPTQHETPQEVLSTDLAYPPQEVGQTLLYIEPNEISCLVPLSFINWPVLNYLKPSFINLPWLFFTRPLASHLTTLNGLH